MNKNITDRIICILSYWSAGFFGILYLIFAYMTKKTTSSFVLFNIYQSLFISIVLYILSFVYNIFINLVSVIPVINKIVFLTDNFIFRMPVIFNCTFIGLCLIILYLYLALFCVMGKKPFIPLVSQIINENFGG